MKWLAFALAAAGLCALILFSRRLTDKRTEKLVWSARLQQAGPLGPAFEFENNLSVETCRIFTRSVDSGSRCMSRAAI